MKSIRSVLKSVLWLSLCLILLFSLCIPGYADKLGKSGINFGNSASSSSSSSSANYDASYSGPLYSSKSNKTRMDESQQLLNAWANIKNKRSFTYPDKFTRISTYNNQVRQVDINSYSNHHSNPKNSTNYAPYDYYSVIYYYNDGIPYFALVYDNSADSFETKLYFSEGEIVYWKNEDKQSGEYTPAEFSTMYEHALFAYARAMYDCFNSSSYTIQVGCFKDSSAVSCYNSMVKIGVYPSLAIIDNCYCILVGSYSTWDDAARALDKLSYTKDCGIMFVRKL